MKYLDLSGLAILWAKCKSAFAQRSELANYASMEHTHTEFTVLRNQITNLSKTATTNTNGLMSARDKVAVNNLIAYEEIRFRISAPTTDKRYIENYLQSVNGVKNWSDSDDYCYVLDYLSSDVDHTPEDTRYLRRYIFEMMYGGGLYSMTFSSYYTDDDEDDPMEGVCAVYTNPELRFKIAIMHREGDGVGDVLIQRINI